MTKKNSLFAAAVLAGVLFGCASVQKTGVLYEEPDYTVEDIKKEEIKRIDEIAENDVIQSYWRSFLLGDEAQINKNAGKVAEKYKSSFEEKDYFSARKCYTALRRLKYPDLDKLGVSLEQLDSLCNETVSSFSGENRKTERLSKLIDGTVTVWVDKGIKVENGMGFADRVIGSGFFISKDGFIVTNHHVISDLVDPKYEGYSRLYIKLANDSETRIPAKVVGYDAGIDLAVLKAEIEAPYVFNLGSSKDLEVGDKVYCIGSPIGLERTLTSGIVSARDRMLFSAGPVMQIDAAVNSGNSGGPCVDEAGNVQAVVFAGMLQYAGLNFAIPVEYLKAELPYLVRGGEFKHSWIQVYGRTKREGGTDRGVELHYVMPGGNSYRAGLREGDVITEIESASVSTLEDLQKKIMGIPSGNVIEISYERGGEQKTAAVYVSSRPENPGYVFFENDVLSNSFTAIFGMKLEGPVQGKRKYQISKVIKGSSADESGFSESDYVEIRDVQFNDEKTAILAEIYAKKRKKGYLDITMAISNVLDSPYYF